MTRTVSQSLELVVDLEVVEADLVGDLEEEVEEVGGCQGRQVSG